MIIPKAIEINNDTRAFHLLRKEYDAADAIALSNEALKRVEHTRHEAPEFVIPLLPGETQE